MHKPYLFLTIASLLASTPAFSQGEGDENHHSSLPPRAQKPIGENPSQNDRGGLNQAQATVCVVYDNNALTHQDSFKDVTLRLSTFINGASHTQHSIGITGTFSRQEDRSGLYSNEFTHAPTSVTFPLPPMDEESETMELSFDIDLFTTGSNFPMKTKLSLAPCKPSELLTPRLNVTISEDAMLAGSHFLTSSISKLDN